MPSIPRRLLAVPLLVGVAGGSYYFAKPDDGGGQATATERVVEVSTGTISRTVSATGTIEAADTADLSFGSAGTVTAVNVAAGDTVTSGEVLATIDSAELEAAVSAAAADVADAEAKLDSDQDASASDAQLSADESNLASAEKALDAASEDLAGAQLVAEFDGTVTTVDLTVGEELGDSGSSGVGMTGSGTGSGLSSSTLGSGDSDPTGDAAASTGTDSSSTPQIQVVSTGSYVVNLAIDDTEIDLVEVGQEAEVTESGAASSSGAGGRGFPGGRGGGQQQSTEAGSGEDTVGQVTDVGAIADASSGVAGYPVEVAFTGSGEDFHVGATATVEIVYEEIADALQVPAMAVTTTGGESTVIVTDEDGHEETRPIETGITSGGMLQVTTGLEAGEQVVIRIEPVETNDDAEDDDGGGQQQGPPGGFQPPEGFELPEGFDPSQLGGGGG